MKAAIALFTLLTCWGMSAQADELARVISSTPILEQVSMPATVCINRQVEVQGQKSGSGAIMGAVAGGAIGNAIGEGSGNALATAIGVIGGAVLGDRIEGAAPTTTQTVQDCHQETRTETRTRAYRVVYEYAGKRYEIETLKDPGATIPVRITPAVPLSAAPTANPTMVSRSVIATPSVYVRVAPVVIRSVQTWPREPRLDHRERGRGHDRRQWNNHFDAQFVSRY